MNVKQLLLAFFAWGIVSTSSGIAVAADYMLPGGEDYCKAAGPRKTTMVLVDRTAAYRSEDHERLMRGLAMLKSDIPMEGGSTRIDIRTVRDVASASAPIFSGCVPTCFTNTFFRACDAGGVQGERELFWRAMLSRLSLNELMQVPPVSLETALAETIERVTRDNRPDRLIIFSDFLEYHREGKGLPAITFYTEGGRLGDYLTALIKGNYIPDLRGTQVVGFGLGEELGGPSKNANSKSLPPAVWTKSYRFWLAYLQQAGAEGFSIGQEYPGTAKPIVITKTPPVDRQPKN